MAVDIKWTPGSMTGQCDRELYGRADTAAAG
jgi:hypothetical protein